MHHERGSSELSFLAREETKNDSFNSLDYWQGDFLHSQQIKNTSEHLDFLFDVSRKILLRGVRTFPSYLIENLMAKIYGSLFSIEENSEINGGSISYKISDELRRQYLDFAEFVGSTALDLERIQFDPEHPENERRLFAKLVKKFGPKIVQFTYTQVGIDSILPNDVAGNFTSQRLDFLLAFPNGRALIIEPGDHDDISQCRLDEQRDEAFSKIGIITLRPRNSEIDSEKLYDQIEMHLDALSVKNYLSTERHKSTESAAAENLFLLPSLISRTEHALNIYLLRHGWILDKKLSIGIIERDLAVADWALLSFLDRIKRIAELYGINLSLPTIELRVVRNEAQRSSHDLKVVHEKLVELGVHIEFVGIEKAASSDIVLDVSIKFNNTVPPIDIQNRSLNYCSIRNSYQHNAVVNFYMLSTPRAAEDHPQLEHLLESFLKDFFRKRKLRLGQYPIIKHVLTQSNTIGLLPTSGGKSICYQLAALLTPGTTIVIDPIRALMQDQVDGLQSFSRITRVFPWHAGSNVKDDGAGRVLAENLIVFVSPERFLRATFRGAMRALAGADIYINYAVVDEAHCVSMWGHDFRPSYLSLERNIRKFCVFRNRQPIIIALTGTASQLVLIDLKRELNITSLEAIIRPKTFGRDELQFSIIACPDNQKMALTQKQMQVVAHRLGVSNVQTDAWGIIFAPTPTDVWKIFGTLVGDAQGYVRTALVEKDSSKLKYGLYCGSSPKDLALRADEWERYKEITLNSFKHGHMRLLVGNNAVSVGIDNEKLNYVINYKMPSSLEGYYQQCGRAGRNKQTSECVLIFSDNDPEKTQLWLDGELAQMGRRYDDIGTVSYFHEENFPGENEEKNKAITVLKDIFRSRKNESVISGEGIEKYIAYWLMLGVIDDYTAEGMGTNSRYRIILSATAVDFLRTQDKDKLRDAMFTSLHDYLLRYKLIRRVDIEREINLQKGTLAEQIIQYLIHFVYSEIAYQRKQAIGTMWKYCKTPQADSDSLKRIISAYFDRSQFSDDLDAMAEKIVSYDSVLKVIKNIEGVDDIERLYWETSRLLDERYRADWATINLYSILAREGSLNSSMFIKIVDALNNDPQIEEDGKVKFLAGFCDSLISLGERQERLKLDLILGELFEVLYLKYRLKFIMLLDDLRTSPEDKEKIRLRVAGKQLDMLMATTSYEKIMNNFS
ncbi:DEAD/DEAH box helicase [Candidatus Gracilibacteria bacterium]|nr:DEAD/DEAH box helicase [Candidatus Gracilibacteria bacterium]